MESSTILLKKSLERQYSNLNEMQRQAVFTVEGPLLILAGAGSGKTTVLINRIDYMVRYGNAYFEGAQREFLAEESAFLQQYIETGKGEPEALEALLSSSPKDAWKILAITFTNKAAGELRSRLEKSLGTLAGDVQASTFHSFCVRLLRRESHLLGYNSSFTIYDTDDSIRVIKAALKRLQLDEKMLTPRSVLTAISRAKDELLSPDDLLRQAGGDFRRESIARVYTEYQKALISADALDFDDIIVLTVRLFQQEPERLDYYQNRYQYIMVDEYQDTNHAQYLLISLLAQKRKNLCVVGDDDQSIYKFRGATIENILSFEKQFENAKVIRLEQNYRSTQNILSAANAVIANNLGRKGKNLWTDHGEGELIELIRTSDELAEARAVADQIETMVGAGGSWGDHAVLYRMNAQSNAIERTLARRAIPYRIIGGLRFYERKEIKDLVAYLSVLNNPNDNLRLLRIINEPKRGIGTTTTDSLQGISATFGESVYQVAQQAEQYANLAGKSKPILEFLAVIEELLALVDIVSLPALFDAIIEKTGYLRYLEGQKEEGLNRIENIFELKGNMILYDQEQEEPTLSNFLEEIALYTDLDNYDAASEAVILMTVHSAKGLEFESVYLIGMDEGIFPSGSASNSPEEIEEERRLAYVAFTRAKKNLFILGAERRMLFGKTMWGKPSRFVKEIPAKHLNSTDHTLKTKTAFREEKPSQKTSQSIGIGSKNASTSSPSFGEGDRVSHKIFGEGTVESSSPMGNDTLLEITFDKAGKKRIMANFAKLQKI